MAAQFAAASTQYLVNATPGIITAPFTVGMWVQLAAVGAVNRTLFALSDTAVADHYFLIRMRDDELVSIVGCAGATGENVANTSVALIPLAWTFIVGRFIASNNRRVGVLQPSGIAQFTQSTTDRAAASLDTMTIGALSTSGGITEPWDGAIGEFWITNADVGQATGVNLTSDQLRQLAYGGPFSLPRIAKDIIEYRSFRKAPASDADEIGEVFHGALGRQVWTNTNGVTIGPHPPLPYWYVRPAEPRRLLTV